MPSPPTTDLPRPKSWDEFEDMCSDLLKRIWKDPYVVRHGRSGQAQNGVDIYGQPEQLGGYSSDNYAAAQCKRTDDLDLKTVREEVAKAEAFSPKLSLYLILTTAPNDVALQKDVRNEDWPFPVRVLFWESICLELSGHPDLLQKHYPGWMKRSTTKEHVMNALVSSKPSDFDYNDNTGEYYYKDDIKLRIVLERGEESDREFDEPWVRKYPDKNATRQPVYVYYAETRVLQMLFVYVDGARHIVPLPKSHDELTVTRFQYQMARILNEPILGNGIDFGLQRAGIVVLESD